MKFELGVYSFGAAGKTLEGETVSTAQAVRNLLEQIRLAEQAGLDFYGVGEHHTASMPVSSPSAVINAAAAVTTAITLSTAVSVLSTDDPIRLYQQMAIASIVSGGRVEIIAGRGSLHRLLPPVRLHRPRRARGQGPLLPPRTGRLRRLRPLSRPLLGGSGPELLPRRHGLRR